MNKNIGYIICEEASEPVAVKLTHDKSNKNRVFAEGILQDVERPNRNGRTYRRNDLFPAIASSRIVELLKSGNLKGEAGHPLDKSLSRQAIVDPTRTQVCYTKLWTDRDLIMAQFRGTHNALGQEFNDDLLAGELPSFSLRALGSLEEKGGAVYAVNLKPITWDRVYYPSHEKAYTTKLLESGIIVAENQISTPKRNLSREEKLINENGILIPITNGSVVDFIKEESGNIKTIKETFDVLYESMEVVNNGRNMRMTDRSGNTLMVNLESYVQDQIMDYCFEDFL